MFVLMSGLDLVNEPSLTVCCPNTSDGITYEMRTVVGVRKPT